MSKNKLTEEFHQITGLPYSECRRRLREAHWDIGKALLPDLNIKFDALAEAVIKAAEAAKKVAESLCKAINSIDWEEVLRAMAATKERITAEEHKEDNTNERSPEEKA